MYKTDESFNGYEYSIAHIPSASIPSIFLSVSTTWLRIEPCSGTPKGGGRRGPGPYPDQKIKIYKEIKNYIKNIINVLYHK